MKHGYHSLNQKGRRITKFGLEKTGLGPKLPVDPGLLNKHVLYALFFDARGIVARIPVPEPKTVTGICYAEQVLPIVVNHYMATLPRIGVRGLKLLHHNAPAQCSSMVQDYLKTQGFKTSPHPAYSPDLAPCDFWLNPVIRRCLSGRKFETRTAVGRALFQCTDSIPKCDYKSALKNWIKRLKKCVEVKDEYLRGWTSGIWNGECSGHNAPQVSGPSKRPLYLYKNMICIENFDNLTNHLPDLN